MLERSLIIVCVVLAVFGVWALIRLWIRFRMAHTPAISEITELAGVIQPGRPAVLAFSTPGCAECRSLQKPALEKLNASMGDSLQIAHLLVPEHPDVVQQFGILTVPATVILDNRGMTRHINLGYTSSEQLQSQISGL